MSYWLKQLPNWTSIVIWGIGIPSTYYGIYKSDFSFKFAGYQTEILEERSASLTAVIWFTITAVVLTVRYIVKKRTSKVLGSEKFSTSSGSNGTKSSK
jgi:hypothetical protein